MSTSDDQYKHRCNPLAVKYLGKEVSEYICQNHVREGKQIEEEESLMKRKKRGKRDVMMVKEKERTHWKKWRERKIESAEKNSDMPGNVG